MKALKHILPTLLLVLTIACQTTEIDLCYSDHPHRSDIAMTFDFGSFPNTPDSMVVFAVRNLNLLRYGFRLAVGNPSTGFMLYPAELREPATPPTGNDRVALHSGDYDLVAFSGNSDIYQDNLETIMSGESSDIDSLCVTYQSYPKTSSHSALARFADWSSRNSYSNFIIGGDYLPTFASRRTLSVPITETASQLTCPFNVVGLSQHVIINFEIKKDAGVVVDSILAELSGVAHKMYLMTGKIDVGQTYKTLFKPSVTPSNNAASLSVKARGEVWVTGLVRSADHSFMTGPGILYINVYAHTADSQSQDTRPIVACINLYNLLAEHPSLIINDNDEIVQTTKELNLVITPALLNIEARSITSEEGIGIDHWESPLGTNSDGEENSIGLDV